MNKNVLDDLAHWMVEREGVRVNKENGRPKPWTSDSIIQSYRFCNVRREDDHVTKWFARNWRSESHWRDHNLIPAIMLGRTINWPLTLERLGFPHKWDKEKFIEIMDGLMATGEKVWTGAYMITAGPPGVRKSVWVMNNADSYFTNPPKLDPRSIENSWQTIMDNQYPCVGPFMAGQIIADLKHTSHLCDAGDWMNWAAVGPGSMRGLNRIYDRPIGTNLHQKVALAEMRAVRTELDIKLCLQDVQNCLCELDKYERVKLGQGKPRSSYKGV